MQYFLRVIDCYQQLQQFNSAEKAIQARLEKYNQGSLLVELGYNLQLQKKDDAKIYYDQAIGRLKKTQMKFTVSPVHSKKYY
jgi:hypothetical protein